MFLRILPVTRNTVWILFASLHGSYFCDVEIYNTGVSLILSCEFKDAAARHLTRGLQKARLFLFKNLSAVLI